MTTQEQKITEDDANTNLKKNFDPMFFFVTRIFLNSVILIETILTQQKKNFWQNACNKIFKINTHSFLCSRLYKFSI